MISAHAYHSVKVIISNLYQFFNNDINKGHYRMMSTSVYKFSVDLLNKSSCQAATLVVTQFTNVWNMILLSLIIIPPYKFCDTKTFFELHYLGWGTLLHKGLSLFTLFFVVKALRTKMLAWLSWDHLRRF